MFDVKAWVIRRKFEQFKKQGIEPWLAELKAEAEGERDMGTISKGLVAALVGGAVGAISDQLAAGFSLDPESLKHTAGLAIAGAVVAAGAYLKGLFTPVPKPKPEIKPIA